jgi:hypothetical protein
MADETLEHHVVQQAGQKVTFLRHENFESWYANNIQYVPSEWDLKLIFGEIEPHPDGTIAVLQHTAIVQSWLQAKLMHYWLTLQLAIYEQAHGTIPVPMSVMPPEPTPPEGNLKDDPATQKAYEYIKKAREQFFTSLAP